MSGEQNASSACPNLSVVRRWVVAVVLAGLALSGCDRGGDAGTATPVDPASVPASAAAVDGPAIRGTVRTPDGKAVPGARVEVTLVRSKSERAAIGIGAAASLGLSCLGTKQGCRAPHTDGVSAADGTYAVKMPVNNGEEPVGVAVSVVAGTDETNRVGTTVVLPAKSAEGARLDLPVAAKTLTLKKSGTELRVRMPEVKGASPSGAVTVSLTQLAAEGDVRAATADFSETKVTLPFDLRVAEDSRLLVVARQAARVGGREATLSATSVLTGTQVPASRDASCSLTDSRGKQKAQKPCGLTDGILGGSWAPADDPKCAQGPCPGTAQNDHRDVVVRLKKAIDAKFLVVRGCGFTCVVTVSSDGKRYRELPKPDGSAGVQGFYVQPLSGKPVLSVRVRTATGGFFTSLREVSLFR